MRFAEPYVLALLVVPVAQGVLALMRRKRPPATRIGFPALAFLGALRPTLRTRLRHLPAVLRTVAFVLLVVGLARPQVPAGTEEVHTQSRNIMFALDISSSMKAGDFQPGSRLTVAQRVLHEFVARRQGDLVGLVLFAGRGFLQAPLTPDVDLLGRMIDRVDIGMLPDGTAIGTAIALSLGQLKDLPAKGSVVVLITDGANNTGKPTPLEAAEAARALGIRIHAIGLSTIDTTAPGGPYIWRQGRQADRLTTSDEVVLKRLTARTGGTYYRATDPEALSRIMDEIDPLERRDVVLRQLRDYRELYAYAVGGAVVCLLLALVLDATWLRRLP